MTVPAQPTRVYFTGNGSTGPFTFPMVFNATGEIYVTKTVSGVEELLAEGTHYSVSGALSANGGSITLTSALATGYGLMIQRIVPFTQPYSFRNQGAFYPETHERAFDRLEMQVQQVDSDLTATETQLRSEIYGLGLAVSVVDLGLVDNLEAAVSAFGSAHGTITIATSQTLTGSVILHENLILRVVKPAIITIPNGSTLTINSPFDCGTYQIFNCVGTGKVVFGPGSAERLTPFWFASCDASGVASSQDAFDLMADCLENSTVGRVYIPGGIYKANIKAKTFQSWEGAGVGVTRIVPADSTTPLLHVSQSLKNYSYNEGIGFNARNFTLDGLQPLGVADSTGTLTGQHGIHLDGGVWLDTDSYPATQPNPQTSIGLIDLDHIHIVGCSGHGIFMDGTNHGIAHNATSALYTQVAWADINNCQVTYCKGNGIRIEGVTYQTHIGGGCLVEKNAAWMPSAVRGAKNERAQLFMAPLNNGYNYRITVDGGSTFQSTTVFSDLDTAWACGISLHGTQSISVRDVYVENNTVGIYVSSTVTRGARIQNNMLNYNHLFGILVDGGSGITIDNNDITNNSYGIGINVDPYAGAVATPNNVSNVSLGDNTYSGCTTNRVVSLSVKNVKLYDLDEALNRYNFVQQTSAAIVLDLDLSDLFQIQMDGTNNITSITFNGTPQASRTYRIFIVQGAGGTKTVTGWPANIKWSNNDTPPVISTGSYRGDWVHLLYYNGYFREIARLINCPA